MTAADLGLDPAHEPFFQLIKGKPPGACAIQCAQMPFVDMRKQGRQHPIHILVIQRAENGNIPPRYRVCLDPRRQFPRSLGIVGDVNNQVGLVGQALKAPANLRIRDACGNRRGLPCDPVSQCMQRCNGSSGIAHLARGVHGWKWQFQYFSAV